jgi:hypothetical protein
MSGFSGRNHLDTKYQKWFLPQFNLLHFPPPRRDFPPFAVIVGFTFPLLDLDVDDLFPGSPVITFIG